MIYNRFKNAGTQILTEEQFLPIQVDDLAGRLGRYFQCGLYL